MSVLLLVLGVVAAAGVILAFTVPGRSEAHVTDESGGGVEGFLFAEDTTPEHDISEPAEPEPETSGPAATEPDLHPEPSLGDASAEQPDPAEPVEAAAAEPVPPVEPVEPIEADTVEQAAEVPLAEVDLDSDHEPAPVAPAPPGDEVAGLRTRISEDLGHLEEEALALVPELEELEREEADLAGRRAEAPRQAEVVARQRTELGALQAGIERDREAMTHLQSHLDALVERDERLGGELTRLRRQTEAAAAARRHLTSALESARARQEDEDETARAEARETEFRLARQLGGIDARQSMALDLCQRVESERRQTTDEIERWWTELTRRADRLDGEEGRVRELEAGLSGAGGDPVEIVDRRSLDDRAAALVELRIDLEVRAARLEERRRLLQHQLDELAAVSDGPDVEPNGHQPPATGSSPAGQEPEPEDVVAER